MKYVKTDGGFAITEYDYFDPAQSFACGQCFRFEPEPDGAWSGVTRGAFVRIRKRKDGALYVECKDESVLKDSILPFLALDADYGAIRTDIRTRFSGDPIMRAAMKHGRGIRILRQEPWEALCSFIISQNNNIPRIKKIIETLCRRYGAPLGSDKYAFPTPQALRDAGTDELFACRTGFRAKYLYDAACAVCSGNPNLSRMADMSTPEASAALQQIKGVGEKVAACTLLFGLGKTDAFPVDVWMKRILHDWYGDSLDTETLGSWAGVAQQYLFYYARSGALTR